MFSHGMCQPSFVDTHVFGKWSFSHRHYTDSASHLCGISCGSSARRAYTTFYHRSRFDVCFQSAPLPKLFPADPAQKQLLLRMDSHVSLHVFFKAKAPTTHAANTWSLPSGTSHMPHQISILSKRFPADSADKWFLSCVCSHVQLRVFVAFKMFAANFTVIYLGVSLQAKLQGFLGLKMFPTHATHICILLAFLHMLQERGSRKTY